MLDAMIRPIFGAEDSAVARDRLSEAVAALEGKLPKVQAILEAAEEDVLAFYSFPPDHRRKIRSTKPARDSTARLVGAPTSSASSPTTAR